MDPQQSAPERGRRRLPLWLAAAAAGVGLALVAVAVAAQVASPEAPSSAGRISPSGEPSSAPSATAPSGTPTAAGATRAATPPLPRSLPARIRIPAIGVDSEVFPIGLAADGTLAVPQPGPRLNKTAWFKSSPTPGQPGPSIIEGHVDSESGPSVFYRLGGVHPGQKIRITRQDGIVTVFTVDAVRDFPKSRFPTRLVYGGRKGDLGEPQLRLITCSDFDASIGHHTGNEVVFAHLTGTHQEHH